MKNILLVLLGLCVVGITPVQSQSITDTTTFPIHQLSYRIAGEVALIDLRSMHPLLNIEIAVNWNLVELCTGDKLDPTEVEWFVATIILDEALRIYNGIYYVDPPEVVLGLAGASSVSITSTIYHEILHHFASKDVIDVDDPHEHPYFAKCLGPVEEGK